ncbi:MAG: hypothetical protein ACLU98_09345 [Desulfovibrio fairfieldensis]
MAISIDTLKRLSRDQRNFFLTFGLLGLGILIGISLVYLEISDILREQAEQRSYLLAQTASTRTSSCANGSPVWAASTRR